jgi:methylglutaconyl-CoA hydratase
LTNPLGSLATGTLPVAVFGSTARQAWGKIIGSPSTPGILAVGTTNIGGQKQSTAWISTNHPDVTAYDCCAGDSTCSSSSQALVADEQIDFVTACWMQAMAGYSWDENHADASRLAEMFWVIDRCPVPVIARIQGDAYAGGVGLVACADIAVAADTAGFCLSEAKLGLLPGTIAPYVVRAMGERAARRYFTTAERFSAAEAHRLGLVHEVVTADQLDARVDELAALLCANGPAAVRACKRLVQDVAGQEVTPLLRDDTARRIADIRASAEGRAGVASFLNKTPPPWR